MFNSIKIIIETSSELEGLWFSHKERLLLLKILIEYKNRLESIKY